MQNKIKKNWQFITIVILAVSFFILTGSFNYLTQKNDFVKWASPDETANYIFTKLYATTDSLIIKEKYNLIADNIIHPRSFRAEFDELKPMSFLGIILIYGKIAHFTSIKLIPYLTPFFGGMGIIFFYLLIRKLFDKKIALFSALILAVFPPYIYYSSRSMFHNILFVVMLIIGFYFSVLMNGKKYTEEKLETPLNYLLRKFIFPALAGFFIGLAIITRTSELIWLGPVLFILWASNFKTIGFTKLLVFLSFIFLSFLPILYWNQILYGSIFNSGYPEMNTSISTVSSASSQLVQNTISNVNHGKFFLDQELFNKIKNTIFYFGFDQHQSYKMFYYYFFEMFSWLFWGAVAGFIIFLMKFRKINKGQLIFISCLAVLSVILLFYYGSWEFHDNPDPKQTTIGNSYTRYWLPVYLGAIPLAALLIVRLSRIFRKKLIINLARILAVSFIFFISLKAVLFQTDESLVATIKKQQASRLEFDEVLNNTPDNSVIISRYHDKLFFPERKVILGLFNDDNMNKIYARLTSHLPVYYYNFSFNQKDLNYLNNTKLAKAGLKIREIKKVNKDFTLYKLEK